MTARAVLASRNGSTSEGFEAVVSALGYEIADVLVADRAEDNEYHLPPGMVETLQTTIAEAGAEYLAIGGVVHEGQMVDLELALPSVQIRDRRGVVWERLAEGGNSAAQARLALQERRIERRMARHEQRSESTTGPSGTSGTVADRDRACTQQAQTLADEQAAVRQRITESYDHIETHITVVGPLTAPTTDCWAAITGEAVESGPLRPAIPKTALAEIGPHSVGVTVTPGLPLGEAEWVADAVPGTVAAIERAEVLLAVECADESVSLLPDGKFDGTIIECPAPEDPTNPEQRDDWGTRLSAEIQSELPTIELAVSLPYSDEGHAMVSTLHEHAAVETVNYDETIQLVVESPASAAESLGRQIKASGGDYLERSS